LIGISAIKEAIEEDFECQECGQVRKIYEIAILAEPETLAIQELERKIEAKRKLVKQLEAKRSNLEKELRNRKREPT
jgi:hypothetical protein